MRTSRKYILFFCSGYLNQYYSSVVNVSESNCSDYVSKKVQSMFDYIGFKPNKIRFVKWVPLWLTIEIIASIPILLYQYVRVAFKWLFVKHKGAKGKNLVVALSLDNKRLKDIIKVLPEYELCVLDIPFKKNNTDLSVVRVLSGITIGDVFLSFISAIRTVFLMAKKYGKRDVLFRAYSSFSFYLACYFIERNKYSNRYIYYSTYSRWAFPLCQKDVNSVFIQHGVIFDRNYIRVGSPTEAYYIDEQQRRIVENRLFSGLPKFMGYRPHMEFTSNEKLLRNGQINVLIVGVSFYFDKQREITETIYQDANVYIKPHPRDTNTDDYIQLSKEYGCIILEKTDYPKVDLVLSYASTLADEYRLVGVRVVRYDIVSIKEIKELVVRH